MYLSGLQLKNFRNFRESCFLFGKGSNTIIGENDSGKSNALIGLRILLDDSFFYNTKRLKESDFSYTLGNWKGHWIIISATFSGITSTEKESEICTSLVVDDEELSSSMSSLLSSDDRDHGTVTLFIRPQKNVRKKLFDVAGDSEKFEDVRNSIRLSDYEFYFTAKSTADFCNTNIYEEIVGDIDNCSAVDPEDDNSSILGTRITIADVQSHISVVFIDALRDVLRELHTPRNPIRRIIESIESSIDVNNVEAVKNKIKELNSIISNIQEVGVIGDDMNKKLLDILGVVYSPEINLASELSDEINSLSRFITMKPKNEDDLDLLGLGHLNMIYVALKIVEFEACRSRELLNIMIIEEPEAHIHSHIQKTLFRNLSVEESYTQVLMTTHSVHLAESSEISSMNILKNYRQNSKAMQPTHQLDVFGRSKLKRKRLSLTKSIERYLDAKRNVLLFSKGVLLVEGDGEEILLPNMVRSAYGISLDEIGIGLVNVGSTAFEYIACVFDDSRIQRFCAILTDMDVQAVGDTSSFFKPNAEAYGQQRKDKLDELFGENRWVDMYYANHTFEIEFANSGENVDYLAKSIDKIYVKKDSIAEHIGRIKNADTLNEEVLFLSNNTGKGWFATIIADEIDECVSIPHYIAKALAFASQETMSLQIYSKMLQYSLAFYDDEESNTYLNAFKSPTSDQMLIDSIMSILSKASYESDAVIKLIKNCEQHCKLLGGGDE